MSAADLVVALVGTSYAAFHLYGTYKEILEIRRERLLRRPVETVESGDT